MAEAIASLISDTESAVVKTRYVVIFAPRRARKRFPEGCVKEYAGEAEARAAARPEVDQHAAVASGPSRSSQENEGPPRAFLTPTGGGPGQARPWGRSEGFRLYYLVRWLD